MMVPQAKRPGELGFVPVLEAEDLTKKKSSHGMLGPDYGSFGSKYTVGVGLWESCKFRFALG